MPISGRYGVVEDVGGVGVISTVKQWTVDNTMDAKDVIASNTGGATARRPGLIDWSGNFNRITADPGILLMPGELVNFRGFVGPDDGLPQTGTGIAAEGPAIIEDITCTWNWETNEMQEMSYNMAGNGLLIVNQAAGPLQDLSLVSAIPSSDGRIEIAPVDAAGLVGAYLPVCARQAVLNVTSNNLTYANSCSAGFPQRKKGIVDWNLALTLDSITGNQTPPPYRFGDVANPLNIGEWIAIKIYTNFTGNLFWNLIYGYVSELTGFTVNVETGEIVTYTYNIVMSMDSGVGTPINLALIDLPGVVTYFTTIPNP